MDCGSHACRRAGTSSAAALSRRILAISSFRRFRRLNAKPLWTGCSVACALRAALRTPHCCRCARICSSETFRDCGFVRTRNAVLLRPGHLLALSASCITRRRSPASADQEWLSCFTAKRAEKFFSGGYRRPGVNPNEWYLSPDHPDLEASPDMASLDRDYARYAVFWPAENGVQPATQQWTSRRCAAAVAAGVFRSRRRQSRARRKRAGAAGLSCTASRRCTGRAETFLIRRRKGLRQAPDSAYPSRCPRCDTNWARRDIGSPVRTQRTGFQKLAQVLSDVLLREVGSENPSGRKLVVFSDSRQDAAKLSAGMRFAHYRDSVRQALAGALANQGAGALAFIAQLNGQTLTPQQQAIANAYAAAYPAEVGNFVDGARTDGKPAIAGISSTDLSAGRSTHPAPRQLKDRIRFPSSP